MGCAQLTHGRFTRALVGEQAPAPVLAWLSDRTTETRNYGETDREHLLRPEVEVVFGRDVRRCLPTARFVPFLQPEAATRAGGLHRTAPRRRERNGGALDRGCPTSCLPTHGRGPRPLRRRSTWLLLSPKSSHASRGIDVLAPGAIQQSTADGVFSARRLPLRLGEQPRRRRSTTLLVWTSWGTRPSRRSASPRNGCGSPAQ
jgi:hypothetical protein